MSQASYSRLGYLALKVETTENTAVLPNVFVPILKEDIVTKYGVSMSQSVAAVRSLNLHGVPMAVDAPTGKIEINVEPKTIGYFLKGVYGTETVGTYFPVSYRLTTASVTGTPVVGATLSQATSGATGTLAYYSYPNFDIYLRVNSFNATNLVTGTNPDGTTFTFTPSATLPATSFQVGETITGGTSTSTAVITAVSADSDYILVGTMSTPFTSGETITGGTSTTKACLAPYDLGNQSITATGAYGHQFVLPTTGTTVQPTFTVEIGYVDAAYRLTGCRFHDITFAQKNNIITASITLSARSEMRMSRVTAAISSGSAKVVKVDQTTGFVAGDTIQTWSFNQGIYTNGSATITSITDENTLVITLASALSVGDLIVLRPQTPSYSTVTEFSWIGASTAKLSDTSMAVASLMTVTSPIEDFDMTIQNEIESRHSASGMNAVNRFPSANFVKGLKGAGKIDQVYTDMKYLDKLRMSRPFSLQIATQAAIIGTTVFNYELALYAPQVIFDAFNPNISEDGLIDQKMPYTMLHGYTAGYFAKALLVNDISAY